MADAQGKSMTEIILDGTSVEEALRLAYHDAVREHRRWKVPLSFWENGQVVYIDPFAILSGTTAPPDNPRLLQ